MTSSLVTSIVLARLLSEQEYGVYKYILSIFALFAIFSLPEAFQVVIRYVPRGMHFVYAALIRQRFKASIVGSVALAILGFVEYKSGKMQLGLVYAFLAVIYPAYYSLQLFEPLLQAKIEFRALNWIYVVKATFQFLCVVLFYVAFDSIYLATCLMLLTVTLVNVAATRKVGFRYRDELREPVPERAPNFKRESLLLSIFSVLPILAEQADKILVGHYVDYASLAVYSIGMTLGTAVNGFFKPFITTINAKLVHRMLEPRHYVLVLVAGTGIGYVVTLLLPWVVRIFYGERYLESVLFAKVVLLSMGLYLANTIHYNQSMFHKNIPIRKIYVNNIVVPLVLLGYMLFVFSSFPEMKDQLILLAFLYPMKLFVSSVVLILTGRFLRTAAGLE